MGWLYRIKHKIYKKAYIGQTIRPIQDRLEEHRKGKSKKCRLIYRAIQKYGWEDFDIDWYECPDADLNDHEEFLVEVLETLTPNGYNLKEGGGARGKPSEETREIMKKPKSKEHNQKNREAHLGEKNPFYGKKHTEETKQKNREAQLSRKTPDRKNPDTKRVYQYDLDGNFINSFASSDEAAWHIKGDGAYGTHIRSCARRAKKYKTAYGFKWSYDMDIFI
jgi:group I intron endonuclease